MSADKEGSYKCYGVCPNVLSQWSYSHSMSACTERARATKLQNGGDIRMTIEHSDYRYTPQMTDDPKNYH